MVLYKTINYSNDSGISPYGNLFQGIPILRGNKLCSLLRIKLLQYMCLYFSFEKAPRPEDLNSGPESHLALRT